MSTYEQTGGRRNKYRSQKTSTYSEVGGKRAPVFTSLNPNGFNSVEALEQLDPDALKLTGKQTEKLTVLERLPDRGSRNKKGIILQYDRWRCRCECGNSVVVSGHNLRKDPPQKSCGCLMREGHPRYRYPGSDPDP